MNKIHPKIYDCLNIMRLTKGDTGLPFYAEFCLKNKSIASLCF